MHNILPQCLGSAGRMPKWIKSNNSEQSRHVICLYAYWYVMYLICLSLMFFIYTSRPLEICSQSGPRPKAIRPSLHCVVHLIWFAQRFGTTWIHGIHAFTCFSVPIPLHEPRHLEMHQWNSQIPKKKLAAMRSRRYWVKRSLRNRCRTWDLISLRKRKRPCSSAKFVLFLSKNLWKKTISHLPIHCTKSRIAHLKISIISEQITLCRSEFYRKRRSWDAGLIRILRPRPENETPSEKKKKTLFDLIPFTSFFGLIESIHSIRVVLFKKRPPPITQAKPVAVAAAIHPCQP